MLSTSTTDIPQVRCPFKHSSAVLGLEVFYQPVKAVYVGHVFINGADLQKRETGWKAHLMYSDIACSFDLPAISTSDVCDVR